MWSGLGLWFYFRMLQVIKKRFQIARDVEIPHPVGPLRGCVPHPVLVPEIAVTAAQVSSMLANRSAASCSRLALVLRAPSCSRALSSGAAKKGAGLRKDAGPSDTSTESFGKRVAGDEWAAGQLTHDISRGRYEYISDFVSSLDKGPVKLDFGGDKEGFNAIQSVFSKFSRFRLYQRRIL